MHKKRNCNRLTALLFGVVAFMLTGWANADPPARVARLGYISGEVSFSPAGEDEWVQGVINRPLISGDRLWVVPGARAELQIGAAAIRMSSGTSVTLLNLDDRVAQLELAQGTMNISLRRLGPNQVFEIDTPNLAFSLRRPGNYRIEVDPAGDATTVAVRDGQGEVFGDGAAYVINARQSYRYYGSGLSDYEAVERARMDEFDRWSAERDRRALASISRRYVAPDVIGYEDLDANGTWRVDPGYGNVWVPTRVAAGWAPYRDGHWSWVEPWGWTWIDDAPWGFAVSHYGRWAFLGGTWGWVPGPVQQRAVYAPALVAFVGGSNFRLSISIGNVGGVAWFPLGPREVYRPSYAVSRDYFTRVNTSNTVVNNVHITNVYNNTNVTNITYVNQQVPGAVVAVPTTAFVQSQPVSRAEVRMNREQVANAPVSALAAVAPVQRSVVGAAAPGGKPPVAAVARSIVARTPPPPAPVGFAAKEAALAATPGKPLAPAEVDRLKPRGAPVAAPRVSVAAPTQSAVPMDRAQPSKPAPGAPQDQRVRGQRGRIEQPTPDTAAKPPPAPVPQPPLAAPADQRTPSGQRGRVEQPAPAPVPQSPAATPAEQRTPPGRRGRPEAQPQPVPPSVSPQLAPAPAPQPPGAAPADERTPPGRRGRPEAQPQPVPPSVSPPPAPQPPAAAPAEQRTPPGRRGQPQAQPSEPAAPPVARPPEQRPAPPPAQVKPAPPPPQAKPAPSPPPDKAAPRGRDAKSGEGKAEDKRTPEQIKRDEEQRLRDEERETRKRN